MAFIGTKWRSSGWGVFYEKKETTNIGEPVISSLEKITDYDVFDDFEIKAPSSITDYPVEEGAFSSINKVQQPNTIKVTLIKTLSIIYDLFKSIASIVDDSLSSEYFTTNQMVKDLDKYKRSTQLFIIATPHGVYENYSLENYNYTHSSGINGYTLIATITFKQVISAKTETVFTGALLPDDKEIEDNGRIQGVGL